MRQGVGQIKEEGAITFPFDIGQSFLGKQVVGILIALPISIAFEYHFLPVAP